jgi:hypothetical protein
VDGATLEIDGKAMAKSLFGQAIPLNPGKHAVRVQAPGFSTFETEVTLGESEKKAIDPELAASGAPAGTPSVETPPPASGAGADEAPSSGGSPTKTVVLIGGAAFTVVALAAGIGFTIHKSGRDSEVEQAQGVIDEDPTTPGQCTDSSNSRTKDACAALPKLIDQRDQAATFATIGFIAAGVGAVATVATYFLWNPEPSPTSARIGVAPLPGGGLVGVSGAF